MTYCAYSLARQLAAKGMNYRDIWQGVHDAGFRCTASEALAVYQEHMLGSFRHVEVVRIR